jgi:hypothetical protein
MAIVFTTGTINQPDEGSVGLSMVERIRDDVIAHVAWDLVEEFTPAAGAVRWYVFKCLAAQSGLPSDYYVVIGRTLATGELRLFICETYNAASHIATNYAPGTYSSQFQYDATGRYTPDFVLGTAQPSSSVAPAYASWTPSGTSTKWWITVSEEGFTVAFNGPSNGFFHVGTYTVLAQLPILMPITFFGTAGQPGSGFGYITRNPAAVNLTTYGAALVYNGGGGSAAPTSTYLLGFGGDLRYNDKLQNNQRPVAEIGMQIQPNNTGDQAVYGNALGKQKRVRATAQNVPAGFAFGDAYVLQGRLWVPYHPTDGRMWDTGVASS